MFLVGQYFLISHWPKNMSLALIESLSKGESDKCFFMKKNMIISLCSASESDKRKLTL